MIGPKVQEPTAREEQEAYELATLRDGDTCQMCRRNCGPTARDHRKNRSQGGWTTVDNLQVLGLGCHIWKSEHPAEAVREGWAVPGWPTARPEAWPARRWLSTGFGTVRLGWVIYWPTCVDGEWWEEISDERALELLREGGVSL